MRVMFLKLAGTIAGVTAAVPHYNSHGYIWTFWLREGRVMLARKDTLRRVIKVTASEVGWRHELEMLEVGAVAQRGRCVRVTPPASRSASQETASWRCWTS